MLDTTIRIVQANLNRSIEATETALDIAVKENVDVLAIQEPWMLYEEGKGYTRSIAHSAYQALLPTCTRDVRPRTLLYTRRTLPIQLTQLSLGDPDIQVVDLQAGSGEKLRLINVYNEKDSNVIRGEVHQVGKCTTESAILIFNLLHHTT